MAVLAEQDSAAAQQYVRQGSPTALRAELWALILNISSQPEVRRKDGLNLSFDIYFPKTSYSK